MADLACDVAIVGAGTAGLSAERSARRAGARTLLIDDKFAGTTCATVGCMPSKLLIAAGHAAHAVAQAPLFGVMVDRPRIDGTAVMRRVRAERDRFAGATRDDIATLPDDVRVHAIARFTAPDRLALDDGRTVGAKAIVIATGATPVVPMPFAALGDRVLTNESVFELDDLPASLAVIGAGPLGLELAQAFARLGVRVAVFDQADTPGHVKDARVAEALGILLREEMALHFGVTPEPRSDRGGVHLTWEGGEETFERVLVAAGRRPALDRLNLAATGLALDDKGVPLFDPGTLQCGTRPIFLCGDADADRPVLHEASNEGAIAGANAATWPDIHPARRQPAFSIMFTDPPLAVIGEPRRDDMVIGEASYADQGRARAMARNRGVARLYADKRDGRILGATLLAPGGEHLGHLLAWAIAGEQSARDLLERPFYHPTFEEGLKPALRHICAGIEAPVPSTEDQGTPSGG
jgi:dihydrolipoamide dehydrogenase